MCNVNDIGTHLLIDVRH